ncbi:hypothetical protein LCGC14_3037970 [marine sediment metagenome]|uniref:Uncharacterized protein n=1 Tax=marine sediment metagenome TaxID=412755 RepID=A0A0F8XDP9_9ZZZZ
MELNPLRVWIKKIFCKHKCGYESLEVHYDDVVLVDASNTGGIYKGRAGYITVIRCLECHHKPKSYWSHEIKCREKRKYPRAVRARNDGVHFLG